MVIHSFEESTRRGVPYTDLEVLRDTVDIIIYVQCIRSNRSPNE
jgi:hypothetical protein